MDVHEAVHSFPMNRTSLRLACLAALGLLPLAAEIPRHPKFGFPVYTNEPSGRQLGGQHKPAETPALTPEQARAKFTLPKGFEARLFASEPEVVNPVAMTWDDRGRLWVVELYEYPLGTKPGEKGRDRVKILEDTDGDGRADSVKVFADGFTLATGLLIANDGVYVGAAPDLLFLQDTDGDDVADRRTVVQTGFGLEDRHELLNGFTWGPDGQMYMTHGVFTVTKATDPSKPSEPVVLTAGVARFQPKTRRLEVFAEGTSNPWGVDFDARGNAFVSACVIDHFFHLAPGGLYVRQAGQPPYPYAYDLLPSIVDHRHHMAAYAGVDIYQGDQYPAEFRGMALQGNIHDNAIHRDRLSAKGSTFVASADGDFVRGNDGWFMPVSTQTGPDGTVWVMDWYDRYPCYQNANADPAGVDRERGRVWRIVWTGDQAGKPVPPRPAGLDLGKAATAELVRTLAHPNVWQRRMSQRLLGGRADVAAQKAALATMMKSGPTEDAKLAALWTLFSTGLLDDALLDEAGDSGLASVRMWAARFTGERNQATERTQKRLETLAADEDPTVLAAVATALRQFSGGSLTINTPPTQDVAVLAPMVAQIAEKLLANPRSATDRDVPFLLWTAIEPTVLYDPNVTAEWFREHGEKHLPLSGTLAYKTVRRFCDARKEWMINRTIELMEALDPASPLLPYIMDGLIDGQRGKALSPDRPTAPLLAKLLAGEDKAIAAKARQLGALWGDAASFKATVAKAADKAAPEAERLQAIDGLRRLKGEDTLNTLVAIAGSKESDTLRIAAVRALAEVGGDESGKQLLSHWAGMTPSVRAAAAQMLTTRWQWNWALFNAIARGEVQRGDVPPAAVRALVTAKGSNERDRAVQIFGRYRASTADRLQLIAAKRKVVAEGPVDLAAGHEVAKKTCLVCHKLHGEGAEIGPDLTGVGRSSLDALLHNVINPNEIIGAGYENVEVETGDEQTFSGRLVENTANRVKLLMAGPSEVVLDKARVKAVRVTENSAMPEGLEQMPDADFRNLIWYILAPPQDGKPLTPERRKELTGAANESAAVETPRIRRDGESIALWTPSWQVDCPDFEEAPAKFPEFEGRRNVLMTHPVDSKTPAAIVRAVNLPRDVKSVLSFGVAAHEKGDWELRVVVEGEVLRREKVGHDGPRWRDIRVDLSAYAGRRIVIRLENAATDWLWEFGYWSDLKLESGEVAAK
jgi:putative membrane-bound dehydrogenase-like protein